MNKLDAYYEDLDLTGDQQAAIDSIESFINDKDAQIFILKGYAGTGKTTLIEGIVKYLLDRNRLGSVMAPTGRAAHILKEQANTPEGATGTIHRSIYNLSSFIKVHTHGEERYEDSSYLLKFAVKDPPKEKDLVYIVDEASMVSDRKKKQEFLQFGSGKLLTDLLRYVDPWNRHTDRKILFVGDPAQLLPVGDTVGYSGAY